MNPTPAAEISASPRLTRRVLIPGIFLAGFVLFLIVAVVRGSWADTAEKNPTSAAQGARTQLIEASGHKQVRCAMLLDYPMAEVWKTITAYDRFKDVFPILSASSVSAQADGRQKLKATVSSSLGTWTFECAITHSESPEKCVASWDEPGGDLKTNRGSWTLSPAGPNATLAVYSLDIEVRGFPAFAVRNVLLSRQSIAPRSVDEWLKKNHAK